MAAKNSAIDNSQEHAQMRTLSLQEVGLENDQVQLSSESFSQYIRVLQQNWRQGTVACKTRAEVAFSTRKPWKQKGTGRARAGSLRSPLWRKGGVIFGPEARVKELTISKSKKKNVILGLIGDYINKNKVIAINWEPKDKPKTVDAYRALNQIGLADKKVLLFVNINDVVTHASFSNIPNVKMMLFDQINPYDLAFSDYWMVLEKDKQTFNEMVSTWI